MLVSVLYFVYTDKCDDLLGKLFASFTIHTLFYIVNLNTEAAFLDLNLSIHNYIVSTKIYDKRDDFNFDIVNFPFLDGDVP